MRTWIKHKVGVAKAVMREHTKDKRGLQRLVGVAIALLTLGILVAVSAITVTALRDTQTTNSHAWNASNSAVQGMANMTAQLPTAGTVFGIVAIVAAAALIIGYFANRR